MQRYSIKDKRIITFMGSPTFHKKNLVVWNIISNFTVYI
jgi:hypothetical protein